MANKKLNDVEGIGPVYMDKLQQSGIKDTDGLLAACATPAGRKQLADSSGISDKLILRFANMVDLYRISGVGSEYAELLEAAGVDTVPELARRNAANLTAAMASVNAERQLTRRVPSESEVTRWVEQAKTLPRMLHY